MGFCASLASESRFRRSSLGMIDLERPPSGLSWSSAHQEITGQPHGRRCPMQPPPLAAQFSDRDASRCGNGGRRLPLSKWSAKNQASSSPCPPKTRARSAAALHHLFDASPLGLTQQCQQALPLGNALDLWFVTFRRRLGGGRSGRDLAPVFLDAAVLRFRDFAMEGVDIFGSVGSRRRT